jgi:hypothetical protein
MYLRSAFPGLVFLCLLSLGACVYEVPITSSPTRKAEERLLGDWTSSDGKEHMNVRRLDENTYVVYYDGDLFRAYHSDVADSSFVSVQDLNSNDRKYAYVIWKLSEDGRNLTLRNISDKIVPKESKDSAAVAVLLEKNARKSDLLGEQIEFRKVK